jgi:lactoylglutathione lyase
MADYSWDHVHITSPHPETTAQWFADKFGAEVKSTWVAPNGVAHVIVDLGGANIFVKGRADKPTVEQTTPGSTYGLEHFGILTNDLDAAVTELKAKGVTFVQEIVNIRPGARNAFLRGPDNTLIEIIERQAG